MPDANKPLPSEITFHYVKSPLFRVIHADGMIGSVTPQALIHCAIYSERFAIPQTITQKLQPGGVLGEETGHTGKDGVVRELEADLMMDLRTAKSLRDWLMGRVTELENALAEKKKGAGS